ncbi:MAG TPA: tRNA (adenosine(37)-N6)-dimethylallyltransferase MiaA, partial [Planococcus sp. (in: firmicutes)]|nr:tRNA (adenosine(37)-N6)-dimethylallyltransferase MiaA [Planococcus sp. (in: firmicutes)]
SIGTAKITPDEMKGIPHHLLDIKDPAEAFSVAEYQQLVRKKIEEIQKRGKLPIIVGGTGLYVQAVLFDYRFSEGQVDESLRNSLNKELEEFGPEYMHKKLLKQDPRCEIHPNNTRRVLRALEIHLGEGEKVDRSLALSPMYNEAIIGLDLPREILYDRINRRVESMVEKGLLEEVKALHDQNLRDVQSIQAIGYKEIYAYLDGKCSFEEAIERLQQNSRKYAKRQFTYFKNKLPIYWVNALDSPEKNLKEITAFLQETERSRRIELLTEKI